MQNMSEHVYYSEPLRILYRLPDSIHITQTIAGITSVTEQPHYSSMLANSKITQISANGLIYNDLHRNQCNNFHISNFFDFLWNNNIRKTDTNSYMSSTQDDCKSQSCLSDERGEGCERTNSNFPYRKLFTPDLNVFSFIQKLLFYPSHPSPVAKTTFVNMSFAPRKRYTYATQTIHLNFKNYMLMNY